MCSSTGVKTVTEEPSDPVTEIQVPRLREPEHFLLKVESFSESKMEKYESDEFEAEGYKWKLILYPNGDKERNGSNHISLYLSICDTQNLQPGWKVEADFSFFIYNSLFQKYLPYKLADKTCFNWLKSESGFTQLIPLDQFKEASNGYLFGDTCVFGVEVCVTGFSAAKRQTLSMMNNNTFTWTLGKLSTLNGACLQSESFIIGNVKWNLRVFPKGNGHVKGKNSSVFLAVADDELRKLDNRRRIIAEIKLKVTNQPKSNHVEKQEGPHVFTYCSGTWGLYKLKGFAKNDFLVVEVEITKVNIIRNLN